MKVKIKKLHQNAIIPSYAKPGDAGLDLVAVTKHDNYDQIEYGTGLSIEIPHGYVGFIFPRSSIRDKHLMLSNCVGVIDSGYRGEVRFTFNKRIPRFKDEHYKIGDRIGQIIIMPLPDIELEEADELSTTDRGTGGFGHTGS